MNIHPAIVHFPVALLTLYCLCELVWSRKLRANVSWFWFKFGLVVFGALSSWLTVWTGGMAEDLLGRSSLIELHSTFGTVTAVFFSVLAVLYIVKFLTDFLSPLLRMAFNFLIQKYGVTRVIWK